MNILSVVLGPIADIAKDYIQSKRETKQRDQELEKVMQEKRLEAISKAEDHAQAFRLLQLEKASWRPGFWTITLSVPVIMCFVPGLAPYVEQGFQALDRSTPDWFQYLLGIAVTSAFGYQVADKAYEWWKTP